MTLSEDDVKTLQEWAQIQWKLLYPSEERLLPAKCSLNLINPSFRKSPIRLYKAAFTPGIAWKKENNQITESRLKEAILKYIGASIEKLKAACKEEEVKKKEECELVCTVPELIYSENKENGLLYMTTKCAFVGKTEYAVPEVRKQNQSPADTMWNS